MMARAALGVLVLLLLATPAVSQVPDDKLIVPGQRIGKWTLDMTIDTLLQMNGPRNTFAPEIAGVHQMRPWYSDSKREIWWHEWVNLSFFAATRGRDAQRVEYIFTTRDDFKTDKNIALGATRLTVESVYGQPTSALRVGGREGAGGVRLVYDGIVLAAFIRGGVIDTLFVFRPKTARTLWDF